MNAAVDPSGRILLPAEVRTALELIEGAQVTFHVRQGAVILTKGIGQDGFKKWRGAATLPFGEDVEEYLAILRS